MSITLPGDHRPKIWFSWKHGNVVGRIIIFIMQYLSCNFSLGTVTYRAFGLVNCYASSFLRVVTHKKVTFSFVLSIFQILGKCLSMIPSLSILSQFFSRVFTSPSTRHMLADLRPLFKSCSLLTFLPFPTLSCCLDLWLFFFSQSYPWAFFRSPF